MNQQYKEQLKKEWQTFCEDYALTPHGQEVFGNFWLSKFDSLLTLIKDEKCTCNFNEETAVEIGHYADCPYHLKVLNYPMGVSQWMNYGKKYHYDEFFIKKMIKDSVPEEFNNPQSTNKWEKVGWERCRQEIINKLENL